MQSKKTLVFLALLALFSVVTLSASATHWSLDPDTITLRVKQVVTRLLCILYLLAPGIVFTMMVISVIFFILHAENPEKRDEAKQMFKNALYGGIMVLALVQIAKISPIEINVTIESCLTGGGGGGGDGLGPRGYLIFPEKGGTLTAFTLLIPVFNRRWLKRTD